MNAPQQLSEHELKLLIEGSGDPELIESWTRRLEECPSSQEALQVLASGDLPVSQWLDAAKTQVPPDDSAYWPAVAGVQQDVESQLRQTRAETPHRDTPAMGEPSPTSEAGELAFLEPSDDPAYLGRLHHFEIARVIGRGGMGIVLEAFDTHLQRPVAVKVLNPQFQENDVARQRFCREGRAAAAINHEHVVAMHQVAKDEGRNIAFLVMQLIDGDTLDGRVREGQGMQVAEVARLGMQIASGLAAAHKQGMIHRDIKPANILVERDSERVKITDFGLVRAADDVKLTKTGMVTGTPLYMSPEQTLGETADERSDLFSLGAVLYEMATGIAPFQAPTALAVMKRILEENPLPPHKVNQLVPRPMSDLIMSLIAKKPDDRPDSAASVASVMASIAQSLGSVSPMQVPSISASDAGRLSGNHRTIARRYQKIAWVAAIVAFLALGFALWPETTADVGDSVPSVVLPDNPGTVWSIDFGSNGETVLAAIEDGSIRVWDVGEESLIKSFNAHRGLVWTVRFSPDETTIATSGDDGLVKLWDAKSLDPIHEFDAQSDVRGIAFSPSGDRLVAGNRDGVITILDVDSFDVVDSFSQPGSVLGIDYSADGRFIATGGSDKMVRLFDAVTLDERQTLVGHPGPIYNVAFADGGNLLASVGWNKAVMLWNFETGQMVQSLEGSDGDVWGVSFCGEGSHVVTGDQSGAARIWDSKTGEALATLRGHTAAVHNIALNPNTKNIATSSRDGTVRVWDLSSLVEEEEQKQ
ncbi:MAG: serine/threonine-protein kinase [Planctomycetota bacterium]